MRMLVWVVYCPPVRGRDQILGLLQPRGHLPQDVFGSLLPLLF